MTTFPTRQARPLVAVLFVWLFATAMPAAAQQQAGQESAAPTSPRTVSWYADNPQARARVQLACIEDPGRLSGTPDCVNAQRASVEVALRNARARTGTLNPRDPAYWSNDPEGRANLLIMCRLTPGIENCDAAKRSLLIEAGLKPKS